MYSLKEKLLLIIFFILGIFSLLFFLNFKSQAFPEYNIDFKISRDQAKQLSFEQANKLGISLDNYTSATIFETNEEAKNYSERNVGVKETAQLAQNDLNLWHFNTRFFKPLEKKEYTFSVSPNGKFVGFNLEIPENQQGTSLPKDQAQKVAENFLQQNTDINLNNWEIVSFETEEKTNRSDHTFVWEKKNVFLEKATYRTRVAIFGDQVGSFNQFIKIPEIWLRQYDQERSYNDLAQVVAEAINYIFFGLAIIITFIIQFRHHQLNLNFAKKVAFIIAGITFLASVNNFPVFLYYFPTTQSMSAFITQIVFASLSAAFFSGVLTLLVVATGESIYRQSYKEKIDLTKIFPQGLFSKIININLFIGVFVGFIFLSYVVIYYFLGQKVGFWVPADTNYSDLFNTYIPWIYPLLIGLSAAVLEEGIFRLFGITFLNKYLKNTFLSVAITSIAWAFLHSSYPQSPWFARGLEISIVGFVLGWLYLRFGVIASITAHYTFNAFQTAVFFLSANDLYITVSSLIVALIPLIIAIAGLIYFLKKQEFVNIEKILNQASVPSLKKKLPAINRIVLEYLPLSKLQIILVILSAIILTAMAVVLSFDQEFVNFGYHSTRQEISQSAKTVIENVGINEKDYYLSTYFLSQNIDPLVEEYFLKNTPPGTLEKIYPNEIPIEFWQSRFFKPLNKEEHIVRFLSDGTFYSLDYILDEEEPGAKLSSPEALKQAENYLLSKGFKENDFKLIDQQITQHLDRTDHYFTFEKLESYKEATLRVDLSLIGDKPSGYFQYIKLPEEWVRQKSETTIKDVAAQVALSVFFGATIIFTVITFLKLFRNQELNFKQTRNIIFIFSAFLIISNINNLPTFYAYYDTSIPLQNYQIQKIVSIILGILFGSLLVWIVIALVKNLWEQILAPIIPKNHLKIYIKDALIISYISIFIIIPLGAITEYVLKKFNLSSAMMSLNLGYDTFYPAISEFNQIIIVMLGFIILSLFILVLFSYIQSWIKLLIILCFVIGVSSTIGIDSIGDFLKNFIPYIAGLAIIVLLTKFIFKKNFFAYLGTIYVLVLLSSGTALLLEQNIFYQINGAVLLLLLVLPVLVYLYFKKKL